MKTKKQIESKLSELRASRQEFRELLDLDVEAALKGQEMKKDFSPADCETEIRILDGQICILEFVLGENGF